MDRVWSLNSTLVKVNRWNPITFEPSRHAGKTVPASCGSRETSHTGRAGPFTAPWWFIHGNGRDSVHIFISVGRGFDSRRLHCHFFSLSRGLFQCV